MIRKLKFSNFYSFKDEQKINFLASRKKGYDYFNSDDGRQITKIAGFLGANASGKTNIIRLLSFLSYFVCNTQADNLSKACKTFFSNSEKSDFYIEFEIDDVLYFYNFTIQENKVLSEDLFFKKNTDESIKTEMFSRKLSNAKLFIKGLPASLNNIKLDISLIAFLSSLYDIEHIKKVYNYFFKFETNINELGGVNDFNHQLKSLRIYLENKEIKEEMEDFVSKFDIGIDEFEIKEKKNDTGVEISVNGVHKVRGTDKKLPFNYESRGTQSLFFVLAKILYGLKNNGVILVDEIELGLHPEALNKLITYFIDKNEKGRAQLIFSSHDLSFMNKLDMHQIYLVEKDECGKSFVYRLNQVEGIRPDENFLSKYMAGAYGAFPKIRI